MDLINEGSIFHSGRIMYENERFCNLGEDGCKIT